MIRIWFKMADVLRDAPDGFCSAACIINELPSDVLTGMCQDVMLFLQYKKGKANTANLLENYNLTELGGTEADLQTAVNCLSYIFSTAAKRCLTADSLQRQLKGTSLWTEGVVSILVSSFKQQGSQLTNSFATEELLSVGHLVDIQWKLGMATSSNQCRNLNSIFVTMVLKVSDASGKVTTKSFEMSVPEFQNFSQQFKDMATVLETV